MKELINNVLFVPLLITGFWYISFAILFFLSNNLNKKNNKLNKKLLVLNKNWVKIMLDLLNNWIKTIKENEKLEKENKNLKEDIEIIKRKNNNYQTQSAKYKKCFYAYDYARKEFSKIVWDSFYRKYLLAKKLPMQKLINRFISSRKNLQKTKNSI